MAVTGDKIIHFLYHCYCLCGGNINCFSSIMARLMSAGFAIMWDYMLGAKGKSVRVVAKPLVQNFLDGIAHKPNTYAQCNRYIASKIKQPLAPATATSPS